MLLSLSTWPEVETYLQTSRGIIVPIGSTEQHGPNGLLGTDAICAETVAKGVGEATGALVGPTIAVGMALHHLAFPGSISLQPTTLIALVKDYVASLARHGFERFYFINGHGGNIATLKAAFSAVYDELSLAPHLPHGSRVRCLLGNWFMARSVYQLAKERYGTSEGSHATPSEVALTWWVHPQRVDRRPLDPPVAPSGHPIYGPQDFRAHYPDGRMGSNPSLATPEDGEALYRAAVEDMSQDYRDFLSAA